MGKTDLHRDRADDFAKTRRLEIFYSPDFEHQGAKVFADETHFALAQVDRVKVAICQGFPNGIVGRGKVIDQVEQIGQIAPENFFFESAEAERGSAALLREARMIFGTESVRRQLAAKPGYPFRSQVMAQKLYGVRVGQI